MLRPWTPIKLYAQTIHMCGAGVGNRTRNGLSPYSRLVKRVFHGTAISGSCSCIHWKGELDVPSMMLTPEIRDIAHSHDAMGSDDVMNQSPYILVPAPSLNYSPHRSLQNMIRRRVAQSTSTTLLGGEVIPPSIRSAESRAASRNRTHNTRFTKATLCQLSYSGGTGLEDLTRVSNPSSDNYNIFRSVAG